LDYYTRRTNDLDNTVEEQTKLERRVENEQMNIKMLSQNINEICQIETNNKVRLELVKLLIS